MHSAAQSGAVHQLDVYSNGGLPRGGLLARGKRAARYRRNNQHQKSPITPSASYEKRESDRGYPVSLRLIPALLAEEKGVGVLATSALVKGVQAVGMGIKNLAGRISENVQAASAEASKEEVPQMNIVLQSEQTAPKPALDLDSVPSFFDETIPVIKSSDPESEGEAPLPLSLSSLISDMQKSMSKVLSRESKHSADTVDSEIQEEEEEKHSVLAAVGVGADSEVVEQEKEESKSMMTKVVEKIANTVSAKATQVEPVSEVVSQAEALAVAAMVEAVAAVEEQLPGAIIPPTPSTGNEEQKEAVEEQQQQEGDEAEVKEESTTTTTATTTDAPSLKTVPSAVTKGGRHISMLSAPMAVGGVAAAAAGVGTSLGGSSGSGSNARNAAQDPISRAVTKAVNAVSEGGSGGSNGGSNGGGDSGSGGGFSFGGGAGEFPWLWFLVLCVGVAVGVGVYQGKQKQTALSA